VASPLAAKAAVVKACSVALGLRLKSRHAACGRRVALVTVAGTGLGQIRRVGLVVGKRTLATDRKRPFRLKVTKERLNGHRRIALVVKLGGGKRVTLKASVRALC
jgi:hypothetical protein